MSSPSVFQLSIGARIFTSRSVIWLESGSAGWVGQMGVSRAAGRRSRLQIKWRVQNIESRSVMPSIDESVQP